MGSKRNKMTGAQREAERRAKAPGTSFAAVQIDLARQSRERAAAERSEALTRRRDRYEEWRLDREAKDARRTAGVDALVRLRRLVAYRAELDAEMVEIVGAARGSGCTWAQVAVAVGLSREGAFSRWGRRPGNA